MKAWRASFSTLRPPCSVTHALALVAMWGCGPGAPGVEARAVEEGAPVHRPEAAEAGGESARVEGETDGDEVARPEAGGTPSLAERRDAARVAVRSGGGAEARARLRRQLDEGRKQVKAGDYDAGIATYRAVLELDPSNATVLGELGFAALRKGELDLAEQATRRAIELGGSDASLGATYYNLGRIEEARGDVGRARAAYERSLALRPGNATVEARLKAVVGTKVAAPAQASGLCDEAVAAWECQLAGPGVPTDAALCTCAVEAQLSEPTGASFVAEAAVLRVEGTASVGGIVDARYLALRTRGRGWQLVDLITSGWTPGVFGISNDGELLSVAFQEVAAAPGAELVLRTRNTFVDTNLGDNSLDFDERVEALVCFSAGEMARCATFPVSVAGGTEQLLDDEAVDPGVELGETRWTVTLEFGADHVTVALADGSGAPPSEVAALVGRRSFADAVASPAVRVVDLR